MGQAMKLDPSKALDLLQDIEDRLVATPVLRDTFNPNGVNVYTCGRGGKYQVAVFVDDGTWDYIQYVMHGGSMLSYTDMHAAGASAEMRKLRAYLPSQETARTCFGIDRVRSK